MKNLKINRMKSLIQINYSEFDFYVFSEDSETNDDSDTLLDTETTSQTQLSQEPIYKPEYPAILTTNQTKTNNTRSTTQKGNKCKSKSSRR